MHIKQEYELRDVCGEQVLLPTGLDGAGFTAMVHLNETAVDFYNNFAGREFETADVVAFFMEHYNNVDAVQVAADVETLLNTLRNNGVIDD